VPWYHKGIQPCLVFEEGSRFEEVIDFTAAIVFDGLDASLSQLG
jgi:hypothetical protein